MAKTPKIPINPKVLKWARTTLGYTSEEIATKMGVDSKRLNAWEDGSDIPSFAQLRKIAEVFKRPTAAFFLNDIPHDPAIPKDFRVVNEATIHKLAPKTIIEIRKAQRKRLVALEISAGLGEDIPGFNDRATLNDDVKLLAAKYRKKIGVTDEVQDNFTNQYDAFNYWKIGIEATGVLIFQASLESLDEMRGLAVYEKNLPFILLNTKDSPRAKIFSLLHEFCHLLLHTSGIGNITPNWKQTKSFNKIEVFCNAFAAECLVPTVNLLQELKSKGVSAGTVSVTTINALVRRYEASTEVVLRRLLDTQFITNRQYREARQRLHEQYKNTPKKEGGFVPPDVKALAYNGDLYTKLVLDGYAQDKITAGDVTDYLGVKYQHLSKIEQTLRDRKKRAEE